MRPELRVLLFLTVVLAVFSTAGLISLEWLARKFLRKPRPLSWRSKAVLSLAALGAVCVAFGHYVEPYWLEVMPVRIATSKLPKGSQPIRIVEISDLHCDAKPRLEDRLAQVIAEQKPDLIVFAGDAVNDYEAIGRFQGLMRKLSAIAPTFVVRGNWDYFREVTAIHKGTGVTELNGQAQRLNIRGQELVISGLGANSPDSVEYAFFAVPKEEFRIFVHHFPDRIQEVSGEGIDLYLAGHTHGGQVALPFYGALVTYSRYDKKYEAGLYHVGPTWLYVNRGIGMEGGRAPRVRFRARPEVTVIDLVPAA
ncbi:MAG: metallophosphoesterase family protein [Acidobacteriales bacterium]|nr:metallophosphoesterase family protein [Terriglobales bacterium]